MWKDRRESDLRGPHGEGRISEGRQEMPVLPNDEPTHVQGDKIPESVMETVKSLKRAVIILTVGFVLVGGIMAFWINHIEKTHIVELVGLQECVNTNQRAIMFLIRKMEMMGVPVDFRKVAEKE